MMLLVRTWNVFHGNASPPRRAGFLRRMVELATSDDPDVLCLQEVPVWALRRLGSWSGMTSIGAVARPAARPGAISTWVTGLNQGFFRSGLAGQANAVLVPRSRKVSDLGSEQISAPRRERRIVQAVRLEGHPSVVVANLHATNDFRDPDVPRAEAQRSTRFVERLARPGEATVVAGDFNVADPLLEGFSAPLEGIDDVLVRNASIRERMVWPRELRMQDGVVLSDHAPLDCLVEVS